MKELKLAALSNGIHLFEGEKGGADIGNIVKRDVTHEVFVQMASYMVQTKRPFVNVRINDKNYKVAIEEI